MVRDDLFCFFVLSLVLLIFILLSSSFRDGFLSVNGCHALILTYYSWVKPALQTLNTDVEAGRWHVHTLKRVRIQAWLHKITLSQLQNQYTIMCIMVNIPKFIVPEASYQQPPPHISKQTDPLYTAQFQPLVEFPHSCHSFCTLLCPCSPGQLNHLAPCPGTPHSCG